MATTRVAEIHATHASQKGVKVDALFKFLFPPHLEQPESTGRLDVFGHYGPVDDEGYLRSGVCNRHKMCDFEITKMIKSMNESLLYEIFARPKDTVEIVVKEILPKAISHCYTDKEIRRLISPVSADLEGRLPFRELQDIILKDQRRRLLTLVHGGNITAELRKPIPYQNLAHHIMTRVCRKKKLLPQQEFLIKTKLLHNSVWNIAPLEMQNLSAQLANNIMLLRGVGSVSDKWDRYCAIRQTGKISYVNSRNTKPMDKYGDGTKAGRPLTGLYNTKSLNGPVTAPRVGPFPPKKQH